MPKPRRSREPQPFPIVEVFGYAADADTPESRAARKNRFCRFTNTACEKFIQYGFGYCALTYAAADDEQQRRTYAVCDHRLDGSPLEVALQDQFQGDADRAQLVPEVVLTNPRMSFDYVAITLDAAGGIERAAAIETQAIDIRGGGVGPAWKAWVDGKPKEWRAYFTADAQVRNRRKDNVAYGVNMANIYKRLGVQVAVKGAYLKGIKVPFYVVMQHRPFEYLRRRIQFDESPSGWDITFLTFDYTGERHQDGTLGFAHKATVRTSLASYVEGLTGGSAGDRELFLERVKRKAGLPD